MRNQIIDNLRGLCMLGVVGIHVGSSALATNSFALIMVLEILSRYSVPAFFFVSGYGLFLADKAYFQELIKGNASAQDTFSYATFIKKRLRGAALPYVFWSLAYTLYYYFTFPPGYISLAIKDIAYTLFFGLCCYQLYFMVILLWFYFCYPLWRSLMKLMLKQDIKTSLVLLFVFQLGFNWWSTHTTLNPAPWPLWAQNMFNWRLNYVPFHYLLIFMCGGLAALYWDRFIPWLRQNPGKIIALYITSIIYDLGSNYYSLVYEKYTYEELVNTYHQLSPQGLCYTLTSLLFFCWCLDKLDTASKQDSLSWKAKLYQAIGVLSASSMLIYFLHPLLLEWFTSFCTIHGIVLTTKKTILLYFAVVGVTLAISLLLNKLFQKNSYLKLLATGKK